MTRKLRVQAVPGALQPNFEAFDAGVRRFIGWKFDPSLGENKYDTRGKLLGPQGGFKMLPFEEIPDRAEYRQAVKDGSLRPYDAATAQLCRVPFTSPQNF